MEESATPCDLLSLNVGGKYFQLTKDTAARIPYFIPYLEGRFGFTKDADGFIFLDRDPKLFKHILQYARNGCRPSQASLVHHR